MSDSTKKTAREESIKDFSPDWCQKLLNDGSYQHIPPSTRTTDGPKNSLIARTLFTDTTIRAIKLLYKPGDKPRGTSSELLALISIGGEMCSYAGVLHGGINATIIGEVGGALAMRETSTDVMALNFNVNLRKAVRAPGLVLARAWFERPAEGRKVWVKCRIEQDGVTCMEAENLYLMVNLKGKL